MRGAPKLRFVQGAGGGWWKAGSKHTKTGEEETSPYLSLPYPDSELGKNRKTEHVK